MFFNSMDNLSISFFIIEDGCIVDCNLNAVNMFGYENKKQLIGLNPVHLSPYLQDNGQESSQLGLAYLNEAYNNKNVNFTWRHSTKNGDTFLAYINLICIKDVIFSLITNIDEVNSIEEKLEEKDEVYKHLFEDNLNIIYLADLKTGHIVDANKSALDFYGYDLNSIKKKKYYELTVLDKETIQKNVDLVLTNKRHLFASKHIDKDGEIRDVELTCFSITLRSSNLLIVMVNDMTEKIKQNLIIDTFITQSPYPIAVLDNQQHVININDKFTQLFQYQRDEILSKNLNDLLTTTEFRAELGQHIEEVFTQNFIRVQTLRKRKDNTLVNVEIVAFPITYNNKIIGAYVHYIDITDKIKVQNQLELFKKVLENSNEAILITDQIGHIEWVNKAFTDITGYDLDEIIKSTPKILQSGLQNKDFYHKMWSSINKHSHWQGEIWNKNKKGDVYPEWLRIYAIKNNDTTTNYVGIFRDLSEMKTINQKIRILAQKDVLTGLYNRTYFTENLDQLINSEIDGLTAIIFIDLNHFKEINDTLGHHAGDEFLIELSHRFQKHLNDNCLVARYGGDEFVILLKGFKDKPQVTRFGRKLLSLINKPFTYNGNFLQTSASMGISLYPKDGKTSDELIQNADIAMYVGKKNLEKKMVYYSNQMRKSIDERFEIANLLRDSIEKKAYTLMYEPIYDLNTNKIIAAEMRLTWMDAQLKSYSRKKYLDVAIQTGQINEIFDFMFEDICTKLMLVKDFNIPVSINISTNQLEQAQFSVYVKNKLKKYDINPTNIEFEFTDNNIKKSSRRVNKNINTLLKMGFNFTLDNFGQENSSIAQLKQYHIKKIKLSKELINDPTKATYSSELIKLFRLVSKEMNISLTAKGIHYKKHYQFIRHFNLDGAQGNYFKKPLTFKELVKLIHKQSHE